MKLLIAILMSVAAPGLSAATTPFSIASESLPPVPVGTESSALLLRLKQQAVREYLQRILGPRYERYDALITPEFAEGYISDFQVVKQSADSSQMEIAGHLDSDSLKQWVRVNETKASGAVTLKPLFLISANLAGFSMDPKQTSIQVKQSALGQTAFKLLGEAFQKFNAGLLISEDPSFALARPPVNDYEMRALRNYGGQAGCNSAVWVHVSSSNGKTANFEFRLYNLTQSRQVESVNTETELTASDLGDAKKLAKALTKPAQDFRTGFEESVSKGTLFALEYRVIIEGISVLRVFKQIDATLPKQDFILESSLARSSNSVAEFRVLSPLAPKDFFQRLHVTAFPGMTLKPLSIDSQVVTMRYLN
jgi:hypothetical protein